MASFDENGKYIKTNWKAGDKITATKLNKIEESIEAVNDNDISRYDEMRDKFIILEDKDSALDKEIANVKNTITDNKNDIEQAMVKVNEDINVFKDEFDAEVTRLDSVDEGLRNNILNIERDIQYPMSLAGEVKNTYKFEIDHDGMMSSLMTLDDIDGYTMIETTLSNEKVLLTRHMKTICTVDTSKNYFDDVICEDRHSTHSIDGYDVHIEGEPGWSYVMINLQNLELGGIYCCYVDRVIITTGNSAIELGTGLQPYHTLDQCCNSKDPFKSADSVLFTYTGGDAIIRLHASVDSVAGDLIYKNLQIYKVKECIIPDITLNSLPNGVKDEIKDGMMIKRTKHVNLAELTWVPSSTNDQFPESEFVVYYAKNTPDLIVDPDAWDNEIGVILCNNIPSVPNVVTSSADPSNADYNRVGISGHKEYGELRIKLYKSAVPNLEALYAWLNDNDVHAVYELETPEYIPVNLTIKVDKGDTVVINTTKTMDFTYVIPLNTRAQIDALQETAANTDKLRSELRAADAILQDNIDDLKYELGYDQHGNGYYILPGGLVIQFGYVTFPANYGSSETIDFILTFPEPFPNQVISFITSMSGGDDGWDSRVSGYATSTSHARVVIRGLNYAISNTVCWFAIGR